MTAVGSLVDGIHLILHFVWAAVLCQVTAALSLRDWKDARALGRALHTETLDALNSGLSMIAVMDKESLRRLVDSLLCPEQKLALRLVVVVLATREVVDRDVDCVRARPRERVVFVPTAELAVWTDIHVMMDSKVGFDELGSSGRGEVAKETPEVDNSKVSQT